MIRERNNKLFTRCKDKNDPDYVFKYLLDNDKYMHPYLIRNYYNAALKGTKLFNIETIHKYWLKSFNYTWKNCKELRNNYWFEPDLFHYIYKHNLTWDPPTKEDIDYILSLTNHVLEIGSGTAYWSKVLSHYCEVVSIDNFSEDNKWNKIWFERKQLNYTEALEYNKGFILMIYPYMDMLYNTFKNASIGTIFFIKIPKNAGCDPAYMSWIINSSEIIVDNLISPFTDFYKTELIQGQGVIVRKIKEIDIIKNGKQMVKQYKRMLYKEVKTEEDKIKLELDLDSKISWLTFSRNIDK